MAEPSWLTLARKYIGLKEIPGEKNNPALMSLLDLADGKKDERTLGAQNDDEAYCAKGVSAVLELSGIRSARSAWARSYAKWGQELSGPAVGAIVVFWRKSVDSTLGHVGFVVGKNADGSLMVLGFNQGNAVSIAAFAPARVLSFRWPPGQTLPKAGWAALPVLASNGAVSQNES